MLSKVSSGIFTSLFCCALIVERIGTDMKKPNGQYLVPRDVDSVLNFISQLPIRKVPGIGRVTERILQSVGIEKCGDIVCIYSTFFSTGEEANPISAQNSYSFKNSSRL